MASEGFYITSTAIHEGERIPRKFTSDGPGLHKDMSPPIEWHDLPEGTESLAVVMEDIDAPDPKHPIAPFVHWILANIPASLKGLPAGFRPKEHEREKEYVGIVEGLNDFKIPSYRGPSPPVGKQRYVITVYALDSILKLPNKPNRARLDEAMDEHILGTASINAYYEREKLAKAPHPENIIPANFKEADLHGLSHN